LLLYILLNNIAPIFALVLVGYYVGKKFNLDIYTLSKINFYVFIPAVIFVKIYEADIDIDLIRAVLFTLGFAVVQLILSSLVARICKLERSKGNAFQNAVSFFNTGNFGLPLITLIFSDTEYAGYAVTAQIMILVTQNLCTFTLGFYNAAKMSMSFKEAMMTIFKLPVVYTIAIAFLARGIPYEIQDLFLWPAVLYARQGMIPAALLSLGIQLSIVKIDFKDKDVYLASFMRLCIGPVLAYLLILILGAQGTLAQVLLISSAVPTAINTALIAVELNSQPEFATRVVVISTIFSALTLPVVIFFARQVLFQ